MYFMYTKCIFLLCINIEDEHLYILLSMLYSVLWIKKINVRHFVVCLFISQSIGDKKKKSKKVNRDLKYLKFSLLLQNETFFFL